MGMAKRYDRPKLSVYLMIALVVATGLAAIAVLVANGSSTPATVNDLIRPMLGMFALTSAVWLLMGITRNAAVLLGAASVSYFHCYRNDPPSEWLERPARAFDNAMQAPMLFYVVALLMISLRSVDAAQVQLCWLFVASRAAHAIVHIGWNYVPLRFAVYVVSCVTLATIWTRFALAL
jgi:hypothetical protein